MNKRESWVAAQLDAEGYKVLRNGWPDFLAIHRKSRKVIGVEVKSPGEGLREDQYQIARVLMSAGIDCQVRRPLFGEDKHRGRRIRVRCPRCRRKQLIRCVDDRMTDNLCCPKCGAPIELPRFVLPRPEKVADALPRRSRTGSKGFVSNYLGFNPYDLTKADKAGLVQALLSDLDVKVSFQRDYDKLAQVYDDFMSRRREVMHGNPGRFAGERWLGG